MDTKIPALDMGKAEFRLLGELVGDAPWETVFEGTGVHQCWPLFKYHLLRPRDGQFQNVRSQAVGAEGQLG